MEKRFCIMGVVLVGLFCISCAVTQEQQMLVEPTATAAVTITTVPTPTQRPKLSSLSREECIAFFEENGVVIPEALSRVDILEIVGELEEEPDKIYVISWTVFYDFIEEVRAVVKDYYGFEKGKNEQK